MKWLGNLESLKAFVFALFGEDGKWSSPGGSAKSFRNESVTITWYANKRSLLFNGVLGDTLRDRIIIDLLKVEVFESSKANSSPLLRDISTQTDVVDAGSPINTYNMLSVEIEGLKLDFTVFESKMYSEIREIEHTNSVNNVKDDLKIAEANQEHINALETIVQLTKENEGFGATVEALHNHLNQCKIDLSNAKISHHNNFELK